MVNMGCGVPFVLPPRGMFFACFSVDVDCLPSNGCLLPPLTVVVASARFGDGEQKSSLWEDTVGLN